MTWTPWRLWTVDNGAVTTKMDVMGEVNKSRANNIGTIFDEAETLRKQKKFTEARDLLIDALRRNEQTAQVYFRLGNVYHDQGDFERAEYTYRRAIDHDAHHINAHHNLSVIYRKQGRITESIKQRKKANKIARQHPEKVTFSEEQMAILKGFAKKVIIFGMAIVVLLVALLVVASQFV